ncbi:MAG TPA: multicopper oxidase domain-containing protein, partial [Gemmatimonadota bacterium]|nr:multicopper oxidase domain-containing protein [Gemmatimonadota bacterium]
MRLRTAVAPVCVSLALSLAGLSLTACAPAPEPGASGQVREYFIAADEVVWDYAPSGMNQITGEAWTPFEASFMVRGRDRIGSAYKKALYREYTDATFTTLKPRPADQEYLGFLGPVVRAEVGDTIRITFRNNASFPASLHPHGVFYNKDSEGSPYVDGTSGSDKADDGVPIGGTHVYTWEVPERAGPGPGDGSSVLWMYHSHVQEVADVNAGLVGPMIVTARGVAREDGSPSDVDREYIV